MIKWIFTALADKQKLIDENKKLKADNSFYSDQVEELADSLNTQRNKTNEAERKMKLMQQYADDVFLDSLALTTVNKINDMYVQSYNSFGQRTRAIQVLLREMLQRGLRGSSERKE